MPEGDNLVRIANALGELLVGREVVSAEARSGARLEPLVGRSVSRVSACGKHLLIDFSGGLTLHTHLGLNGSWHRYPKGERWRRPRSTAAAVLEVDGTVCVCFDAPTVELIQTRALPLHPVLSRLGPDVGAAGFDESEALRRLRQPAFSGRPVGEALLDQRLVAGLGNVYRSELCFLVGLDPLTPLGEVSDETLIGILRRADRLVELSSRSGRRVTTGLGSRAPLYVYGRTGRPCRRCATPIRSALTGQPPRRVYWCPSCQPEARPMPVRPAR